jgi:hypothetical protein
MISGTREAALQDLLREALPYVVLSNYEEWGEEKTLQLIADIEQEIEDVQ